MTTARPRLTGEERRSRLAARHHLGRDGTARSPEQAAADLAGLHATEPTTVHLSCWARIPGFTIDDLDRSLYEDRTLLRMRGMRRTIFAVPIDMAAILRSAFGPAEARAGHAELVRAIRDAGIADDAESWLAAVEDQTVEALDRLGEATATDLGRAVPSLREKIPFGLGKPWEGTFGVSTRLLLLLAAEGRIVRGRPRGGFGSSLFRWAPFDRWVPGGLPEIPVHDAKVELVRRYLRAYGPASIADVRWWTGWTVVEARRTIAETGAVKVDLDGGAIGYVLADDVEPGEGSATTASGASLAFLPALDPTIMGWTERDWYLGPHRPWLFDRAGNAAPSIWLDGRVVGGWVQRRDGRIAWRLLEDVGRAAEQSAEARADELESWLGERRLPLRFHTPLVDDLIRP